jgi:hypothetical protein
VEHYPSLGKHRRFGYPNWRLLAHTHPNVHIRAAAPLAMTLITALALGLRQPVHVQTAWDRAVAPTNGTLVLYGVDALDRREQQQLFAWLDATHAAVQLVSVSTEPIFPLVERGLFLDSLYYRLNTILVDAVEGRVDAPQQ